MAAWFKTVLIVTCLFGVASSRDNKTCGALFLSPYIEKGQIGLARVLSRVRGMVGGVESYSGYITVDKKYDSNLFFWFFPARRNQTDAPVLLWLNGGPGFPSTMGAFLGSGPIGLKYDGSVYRREVAWTESFNMLFVDNPVQAGYSFTRNLADGMTPTPDSMAPNMYSLLVQFFKLFPHLSRNDFYTGGQSYAGRYIPALAHYIHDQNQVVSPAQPRIHLKGAYLGAGFCDPRGMLLPFLKSVYYRGFISKHYWNVLKRHASQVSTIKDALEVYMPAMKATAARVRVAPSGNNTKAQRVYNNPMFDILRSNKTRMALHVSHILDDSFEARSQAVWSSVVFSDFFTDHRHHMKVLMDNYKVLQYSGNLDMAVTVAMTEDFLAKVNWNGRQAYLRASRKRWEVNGKVIGWYNVIGNFTRVIIRNAGHMISLSKPQVSLDMMRNFIFDTQFPRHFTPDDSGRQHTEHW